MQYTRSKLEPTVNNNKSIGYSKNAISAERILVNNKLIINSENGNLLNELKRRLYDCDKFFFSVAFINFSGLQLLLDTFKELEAKGVKGKILTSTYLNFTEPKALKHIKKFSNIDLKIFEVIEEKGFHTKAYIFENKEDYTIIIGSSNITQRALKSNVEWNVKVVSKKGDDFTKEVIKEYENLWEETTIVDSNFIERYEQILDKLRKLDEQKLLIYEDFQVITPNSMQRRAVAGLSRLRKSGEQKALVIAAAGTGKTYMSAFDVLNMKPKKVLFLAHREEILRSAQETFQKIYKNKGISTGLLTGTNKDFEANYLFSTVQSMSLNLGSFRKDQFAYLIIDEAHHASSPTYRKVINYFKPPCRQGGRFN